ncbi:TetR family transcriptional regulator [Janthinobacterium sp. PC23-8]|uniref:TetR/AcrR family transcriptional regulator n=1 Tax=Janthinobacterium sp. PC23-8 TaxID=2012679 RepID=UPI000B96D57E|nr:TetR family transcriptional regulator [Janthinobacterium sp. PC23-8]OYO29124.1 TetR family transcriptional regulator [Janthinobacterium sp. PC23-8]
MTTPPTRPPTTRVRRTASLSREQIVDAAIHLLDRGGEAGLTFRTLSEQLATGPGALYGHIANKHDLVAAACEAVIARTVNVQASDASPQDTVRAVALAMFDALDAHPWVGPALTWSAGQLTMVRIIEQIGQQVVALGVPAAARWATVTALLNYILGVGGQNAGNSKTAQKLGANREDLLASLATAWSALDAHAYPFVRSVVTQMRVHDDRADFLFGINLILAGIKSQH